MRHFKKTLVLAIWLVVTIPVAASYAQDADEAARFSDRQLLLDTFLGDSPERLAAAEQDVLTAQENLDAAVADETATPEEISELETKLLEAEGARDAIASEIQAMTDAMAQLSDEQVFALNRSLHNALVSEVALTLDAALLERVIDGDYDGRQIGALIQGLEQEARVLAKRDRFQALAAESGDGKFSDQAERMEMKAAEEKEKFFAKIDRFADPEPTGDEAGVEATNSAGKDAAKTAADDAAKQMARSEARRAARASAKEAAKTAAKSAEKPGKGPVR